MTTDQLKDAAARAAVQRVHSGMVLGLGSGSTATLFLRHLARQLDNGRLHDIVGVPTSEAIRQEATQLGVPLTTLDDHPLLDLTVDGADEVDAQLNLIKGGGGALLREKIVAQASHRLVVVVDESKLSDILGEQWAVPVEVVPFGWRTQMAFLQSLGAEVERRAKSDGDPFVTDPFVTDHGNWILDANFGRMDDPYAVAGQLDRRAGIVEHGLFLGMAGEVIVAGANGVRHLSRE